MEPPPDPGRPLLTASRQSRLRAFAVCPLRPHRPATHWADPLPRCAKWLAEVLVELVSPRLRLQSVPRHNQGDAAQFRAICTRHLPGSPTGPTRYAQSFVRARNRGVARPEPHETQQNAMQQQAFHHGFLWFWFMISGCLDRTRLSSPSDTRAVVQAGRRSSACMAPRRAIRRRRATSLAGRRPSGCVHPLRAPARRGYSRREGTGP